MKNNVKRHAVRYCALLIVAISVSSPALAQCSWYAFWCTDVAPLESADSHIARRPNLNSSSDDLKQIVRELVESFRQTSDGSDEYLLDEAIDTMDASI
jgi:hypothetical protein